MELRIPYNIFVFIWTLTGVLILGHGFYNDMVNYGGIKFDRQLFIQIMWFVLFALYCFNYLKNRVIKKENKKISEQRLMEPIGVAITIAEFAAADCL